MPQLCIRLRDQDKQKLDELEAKLGKNTTEVIRELIQGGHERESTNDVLIEIKTALTKIANRKTSEEIAQIRHIVLLLAKASPFALKSLRETAWFDII
jgi:predicted DNA-binding protein